MASSPKLTFIFLLVAAFLAVAAPAPAPAQAAQEYCRDTLQGLLECRGFMLGTAGGPPAADPTAACCAAYEAAFDADPFCLCYVADGTFGRATGYDVDVARALQIPTSCGQVAPPIELCNMKGLVLPPYAPQGTPAQPPAAQPSSAGSVAPPSFTSPPPPPPPTSKAGRDSSPELLILLTIIAIAALCHII